MNDNILDSQCNMMNILSKHPKMKPKFYLLNSKQAESEVVSGGFAQDTVVDLEATCHKQHCFSIDFFRH